MSYYSPKEVANRLQRAEYITESARITLRDFGDEIGTEASLKVIDATQKELREIADELSSWLDFKPLPQEVQKKPHIPNRRTPRCRSFSTLGSPCRMKPKKGSMFCHHHGKTPCSTLDDVGSLVSTLARDLH